MLPNWVQAALGDLRSHPTLRERQTVLPPCSKSVSIQPFFHHPPASEHVGTLLAYVFFVTSSPTSPKSWILWTLLYITPEISKVGKLTFCSFAEQFINNSSTIHQRYKAGVGSRKPPRTPPAEKLTWTYQGGKRRPQNERKIIKYRTLKYLSRQINQNIF